MSALTQADQAGWPTPRMERFLDRMDVPTPFLVVDLDVVADRYLALERALPGMDIFYAVKANPAPQVIRRLASLGSSFDVASPAEIDLCLAAGVDPSRLSFGNTVKKTSAIRHAFERGVRLFAFDCEEELSKLVVDAPGATVFCRVLCDNEGADWPLSRKFGCAPDMAADLLVEAHRAGHPIGLSFHVGSQQRDPDAWSRALATVSAIAAAVPVPLSLLNIGGGFPGHYQSSVPSTGVYGASITAAVARHCPGVGRIIAEPGRYLVADAGVIEAEVVCVSRKSSSDPARWVYLDIGLFGGLAEALGEAIRYRIRTAVEGPTGPVVIAGPTCDSADVLYERAGYELPLALQAGDRVQLLATGAYTATYASVGFNGFAPLSVHVVGERGRVSP